MATEFKMPQLGLTMVEGTVGKWFKKVGDPIAVGDVLVEISTDKITSQVEVASTGILLGILVQEGKTVPVKTVLAIIGEPGEKIGIVAGEVSVAESVPTVAGQQVSETLPAGEWVRASPLARRLARERGIDLAVVTGTGPNGRVVERDLLNLAAPRPTAVRSTPLAIKVAAEHGVDLATLDQGRRVMKEDVLAALPQAKVPVAATEGEMLAGMRKVIAERMSLSWQSAPHVHNTVEVDMSESLQLKEKMALMGIKLSLTEVIVKCAAKALTEYPMVNNSLVNNGLIVKKDINIGIAVALENGLIVPVVRNADQKSLSQLRTEIAELSSKARQGKLSPDECGGGTFTVSNLGMYGVDHFTPIINPPESAILGVCRAVERPIVVNSVVAIRPMMNLVLGYDHRLIDGALAAQFMARMRQLLEQPLLML